MCKWRQENIVNQKATEVVQCMKALQCNKRY